MRAHRFWYHEARPWRPGASDHVAGQGRHRLELEHDGAHLVRGQITLNSGRTIVLTALDQVMTYAGLLEGTPNARANDRYLELSLQEAERRCVPGARPHLIPPARRDYLREPGDMQGVFEESDHGTPEWLPVIRCIGSFQSGAGAHDPDSELSVLVVVWFQEQYAPPILEPALSQLLALDWNSLANDVDV